ncbi:hypothetical protein H4582DRAFT_2054040 [Lactarius indigo]|nr:hypothetical protein H4582DRAFT_2054040 [Lactarius indigo]
MATSRVHLERPLSAARAQASSQGLGSPTAALWNSMNMRVTTFVGTALSYCCPAVTSLIKFAVILGKKKAMNEARASVCGKSASKATFSQFSTLLITRGTESPGFTDVREGSNVSMFATKVASLAEGGLQKNAMRDKSWCPQVIRWRPLVDQTRIPENEPAVGSRIAYVGAYGNGYRKPA